MAKSCGEYTVEVASSSSSPIPASASATRSKAKHHIEIKGYPVDGVSIGGQETCVIFPTLSLAFDIGRCPQLRPPTIFVPACLRDLVERLFEVHHAMDQSDLNHNLVPLEVREEYELRRDLKGYVIYSVKQKLKQEFIGLPGSEIKRLKLSGVEVCLAWWLWSSKIEAWF
ncbi:Nuclear ribonuclease Z, partial [Zea mays]